MTLFHPGFCLSWFLLPSIAWLPWVAPPPLLKYSLSHTELLALPSMPACLILLSWFRAPPSPPPSPTSQKSTSDPQFPSNTCITTSCPGRPQGLQSRSTDLSPDFPELLTRRSQVLLGNLWCLFFLLGTFLFAPLNWQDAGVWKPR